MIQPWSPSHLLTWVPRFGAARGWHVRVIASAIDANPVRYAQTREGKAAAAGVGVYEDTGGWSWDGKAGFRGEEGHVQLERLRD